jgi:cytochrome c553
MISTAPAAAEGMPLEERIEQCATCHGADGNSETETIPSLAGQPEMFLTNQLVLIREGVRPVAAMAPFVDGLTDADIIALAEHFSALPPSASDEPVNPALVERGAELGQRLRCHSCHGADLAGHEQIPRLAKQRIDYLFQALQEFRDGERRSADTLMTATVAGVSDADLRALAHYVASWQ